MAWTVELTPRAEKQLAKLDKQVGRRIVATLQEVAQLDDPRLRGHGLVGKYAGMWRYRVGDWRIITRLEHGRLVVLVIAIGDRSDIYRG